MYCKELFKPIDLTVLNHKGKIDDKQKKLNKKAISHIRQLVDQSVFYYIVKELYAYSLWMKLESLYERKAPQKQSIYDEKAYEFKV